MSLIELLEADASPVDALENRNGLLFFSEVELSGCSAAQFQVVKSEGDLAWPQDAEIQLLVGPCGEGKMERVRAVTGSKVLPLQDLFLEDVARSFVQNF